MSKTNKNFPPRFRFRLRLGMMNRLLTILKPLMPNLRPQKFPNHILVSIQLGQKIDRNLKPCKPSYLNLTILQRTSIASQYSYFLS